jgi:hypothetical protein
MEEKLAKLSIADKKLIKPANQFISKNQGICGAYLLDIKPKTKVYR